MDREVVLDLMEYRDLLGILDHQDPRGRQGREETLDRQDLLDLPDQ